VAALPLPKEARDAQMQGFREVVKVLGDRTPSPSERAAKLVLDIVEGWKPEASRTRLSTAG
jgi:hypothetical protein